MGKVIVWSVTALSEADIKRIRDVVQNSNDREKDLRNQFPGRYKQRKGRNIYFDLGKRKYSTEIEVYENGD